MWYNRSMKNLLKIFWVILGFLVTLPAYSFVSFNVVVLPTDLFKVCENYYCYPELSNIIAQDVINNFNATGRINSPSLYYMRSFLEQNPEVKKQVASVITRYNNDKSMDFAAMKIISKAFKANSLLIISNNVPVNGEYVTRNIWEMLVLSTDFDISYPYETVTNVTLTDTVNDLVMWHDVYKKKISDGNDNFKAPNSSDAYAKLEFFRMYSKDILSKIISQNIYLRFFPKMVEPQPMVEDMKPEGAYFRFEENSSPKIRDKFITPSIREYDEAGDEIDNSYGEVMFGI